MKPSDNLYSSHQIIPCELQTWYKKLLHMGQIFKTKHGYVFWLTVYTQTVPIWSEYNSSAINISTTSWYVYKCRHQVFYFPHISRTIAANNKHKQIKHSALVGYEGGFQIGGRRVTNLRYADDIILLACSEIQLQVLVDRLERVSRKYGLLINVEKNKGHDNRWVIM